MAYQKMAQLVKDKTKLQEIKTSLTFEEKQEVVISCTDLYHELEKKKNIKDRYLDKTTFFVLKRKPIWVTTPATRSSSKIKSSTACWNISRFS